MSKRRRLPALAVVLLLGGLLVTCSAIAIAKTKVGGQGGDRFTGTAGADALDGRGGGDVLRGLGG